MQVDASVAKRRREFPALSSESIMNAKLSLHASHPHRFANISPQDLRVRAIGQLGVISTLAAMVLVAAVLSGCDPIAPLSASASAADAPGAPNAASKTGFDWRKADPVTYTRDELNRIDDPNAD
jgi:hypothetical protein